MGEDVLRQRFLDSIERSRAEASPFRHWLLERPLTDEVCGAIDALPFAPPSIGDTLGKRETNNGTRRFFGLEERRRFAACADLAAMMQENSVVAAIERLCGIDLGGSFLRIEYCLDTDGFWLEPHTDIGAKLFTMLLYLSNDPEAESWGTDLLDRDKRLARTVPFRRNCGLVFVPGADTWHGFHKRPIAGVRRSIIVNYVKPEWRSRHELAFPDRPIGR